MNAGELMILEQMPKIVKSIAGFYYFSAILFFCLLLIFAIDMGWLDCILFSLPHLLGRFIKVLLRLLKNILKVF